MYPTSRPFHRLVCCLGIMLLTFSQTGVGEADTGWQSWEAYRYSGSDLGLNYDPGSEQAQLALWAPGAKTVSLQLYRADNADSALGPVMPLVRGDQGVWRIQLSAEALAMDTLQGAFYELRVDDRPALDPYARSMAAFTGDGVGKAAIVDLSRHQVSDYARIEGYTQREDAIIYEIHVRDFTADPTIESDLNGARFGSFLAFIEKLDYIRSLGVTHVQLLPVMAYYHGDETATTRREWDWITKDNNYNWGYDPHSYFSPTGFYASDPRDPQKRVDELKTLIEAIHAAGMGVILDVVYNHQHDASIFDPLQPGYYLRGRNDSGAGTDFASERAMARKLIVDSLTYWTREYKVDGYRFDLMGLVDSETIRQGYEAVAALNPRTLFIGEGWRMYGGPGPLAMADQDWVLEQDFAAVFSDDIRNMVKHGGPISTYEPRFISGGAQDVEQLLGNLKGQPRQQLRTDDPGDVVQYIEAHDDATLHDAIALAMGLDPDLPAHEDEIQRRIRLGNTLLLTSQGIAFIHAGQEFGRTKRWRGASQSHKRIEGAPGVTFIKDSYDSPDLLNHIDWTAITRPGAARDTVDYTRGLVALRRADKAFRLGTAELVDAQVRQLKSPDIATTDLVIAYETSAPGGPRYVIAVNADRQLRRIRLDLDLGAAEVLVDGQQAGITAIAKPTGVAIEGQTLRLEPLTATVLRLP